MGLMPTHGARFPSIAGVGTSPAALAGATITPTDAPSGVTEAADRAMRGAFLQNYYLPADGSDWRPAIQRIRAAMASPVVATKRVLIPWTPAGYQLSTGVVVDGDDGIQWVGIGAKPKIYTLDGTSPFARGGTITQALTGYAVAGLYRAGSTAVKLVTAADRLNFAVNDTIQLQVGDITPLVQPLFNTGAAITPLAEFHTISQIDSDGTLHFNEPLVHDFYTWGDGCPFEIKKIDSVICKRIRFENLHLVAITAASLDLSGWDISLKNLWLEGGCGPILRGKFLKAEDLLINITSGWNWNGYRRPYAFGNDTGTTDVYWKNITVIATGMCFTHEHEGVSNAVLENVNISCGATDFRVTGTCAAGGTTTTTPLGTNAPNFDITGSYLAFVSGTGKNQGRPITAYNTGTGVATHLAVTASDNTTVWELIPERWATFSLGGIGRNVHFIRCSAVNAPTGYYFNDTRILAGGMANTPTFGARHCSADIVARGRSMGHPIHLGNRAVPLIGKVDLSGYAGPRGLEVGTSAYPFAGNDTTNRFAKRVDTINLHFADQSSVATATATTIDGEDAWLCPTSGNSAVAWQKDLAKLMWGADEIYLDLEIEAVDSGSVFDKTLRIDCYAVQAATTTTISSWGASQQILVPFVPRADGTRGGIFTLSTDAFVIDKTNTNGVITNGRLGLRFDRILSGSDTYKDISGKIRFHRAAAHFVTLRG
jgi:hypothetical protein